MPQAKPELVYESRDCVDRIKSKTRTFFLPMSDLELILGRGGASARVDDLPADARIVSFQPAMNGPFLTGVTVMVWSESYEPVLLSEFGNPDESFRIVSTI